MLLVAATLVLGGCGLGGPQVPVPSAGPPAPSAAAQREGARLQRNAVALLNPRGGGTPDTDGAAALIEQAAHLGNVDAQLMLAMGHLHGGDGRRNAAAALPWLHRAAQQGQPEAQYILAQLLEAGEGTPRDAAWAAVWFQRAAERGHPQAQFALALMQVVGEGTAADEAEALARLALAEQRGVVAARRYREALQSRVPPATARSAAARVRGEVSRGPVPAVDRALVRFAQSALAVRGRWSAPVDGRDGRAIRAALAAFARDEGVGTTDPFSPAVMDRLRAPRVRA